MNEITYPPGCKDIQVELANDELIRRLKKIQQIFQNLDQNSTEKYKELSIFLGSEFFLQHDHEDVQLLVACCLADIFRINAPESPFQDPTNLKNIFVFLANQLRGLKDHATTSFKRYFYLLENLECVKTFLLCQELDDSQEIIANLFENVFKIINEKTLPKVKTLVFDLLLPLLNESDQISTRVLDLLFSRVIEPAKSNNKETYNLAVNLLQKGNQHFEYLVQNHLHNVLLTSRSNMSHNLTLSSTNKNVNITSAASHSRNNSSDDSSILNSSLDNILGQSNEAAVAAGVHGSSNQFISDKLCLIIYELNVIRPALLELVMPQLEYKLKSSDLKERREYTRLLSKMFSEKESKLAQQLPALWEAYLERFADMNEDIRKICIQYICDFLIQQSSSIRSITSLSSSTIGQAEKSNQILEQIIEQVKNRALDPEESLRYEVIQEIIKAIKSDSNLITIELLNILKERTLDIKIRVRKQALQGLANLYKKIHSKSNSRKTVQLLNWIPTKIMRIYFQDSIEDKLIVERLLNSCIVPYSLGAREKMAQLYYAFFTFDDYSILSLVEIMRNRVQLYQSMKIIIDLNESSSTTKPNDERLQVAMTEVSQSLMDTAKGMEFLKALLNLFKTNINLKNAFKNLVNLTCSCAKSMQLIQIIINNINSLNGAQQAMAKRLIERMSSLIIDKECVESLIELVEYKIKQKLTPKQRRMLSKKHKKTADKEASKTGKNANKPGRKPKARRGRAKQTSSDEEDEEMDEDDEDEINFDDEMSDEESEEDLTNLNEPDDGEEEDEDDDNHTKTTETSNRDDLGNDRVLLKHIDDDGEKGLKLINTILKIHTNYGFANPTTYQKLFVFVNSRKDHIVSLTLRILSSYFGAQVRSTYSDEQLEQFNKTNDSYVDKLKYLCKNGKPKQAKFAVHVIYNNFDKSKSEQILYDLFRELFKEAELKQAKTFITCLISLGHICLLIPHLVGKEIKDFISKTIAKEILLVPLSTSLNLADQSNSFSGSIKKKSNLKLAGKWCENEDELPFNTRARIEAVKLLTRWCLGLKAECTTIAFTLKVLIKLIKENTTDTNVPTNEGDSQSVSEAEKSRIRSVCTNQLLKLAQESAFKPLITAEYFQTIARSIIDPVTNVRDITIKKLQKGLQSNKLPIYYMSIFALLGFDSNRERKTKVKKIYTLIIKRMRINDAKQQQKNLESTSVQRPRILPEMCLPYAVSLIAHNIQIDSLKDEPKVKQIKDCMSVILDPLIENPDGYQIAYIKKVLNKIKTSDDGLYVSAVAALSNQSTTASKDAIQKLYAVNKRLCFICEVFLFHLHSKSFSYSTAKEYEFDVKLPTGFYSPKDANNHLNIPVNIEPTESTSTAAAAATNADKTNEETELDKENLVDKRLPSGSRITISRQKRKANDSENSESKTSDHNASDNEDKSKNSSAELSVSNTNNRSHESKNSFSEMTPTPSKRNKRNSDASPKKQTTPTSTNDSVSVDSTTVEVISSKRSSRRGNNKEASPAPPPPQPPSKTPRRNGKKASQQEEDEKENNKSKEQEESIEDKDEEKKENGDASKEDEEDEEEEEEQEKSKKKSTRSKAVSAKATSKKKSSEQTEEEASPKAATRSSLRQKRATAK